MLQKVLEHYATDKKFSDNPSAILIPLADLMQRSPYIVLSDFPLSRLFPIFRKVSERSELALPVKDTN